MPADVAALLARLELSEFGPPLVKDGLKRVADILELTEAELGEIGMPVIARQKLLDAAATASQARLRTQTSRPHICPMLRIGNIKSCIFCIEQCRNKDEMHVLKVVS